MTTPTRRRFPRWLPWAFGSTATVVGAWGLLFGAIWIGADYIIRARPGRHAGVWVRVTPVDDSTAYLLPSTGETRTAGVLGLEWGDGQHTLLGQTEPGGRGLLRRPHLAGPPVPAAERVWATSLAYSGTPADVNLPYRDVMVPAELGPMPAWEVPPVGERDTVAVMVHGHGGRRSHGLRMMPTLRQAGLGLLAITFRNAYGAPRTKSGLYGLGHHEADDVLAALEWARSAGYRQAILYGQSMGGNICLSALGRVRAGRARLALPVLGLILDSPALEWRETIVEFANRRLRLPRPMGRATSRMVERRLGDSLDLVDHLREAETLELPPTLLLHGTRDRTVPVRLSDRFAAVRSGKLTYHRFEGGEHIRLWNIDPERYESALSSFLGSLGLPLSSKENSHA